MVRRDVHAFQQIKPVRAETLHTGIESECLACAPTRFGYQPVEERRAEAARTVTAAGHQVIDIQVAARMKIFAKAITGHRAHFALAFQIREPVTVVGDLALHLSDEFIRPLEARSQLAHHRMATQNCVSGLRFGDDRGFRNGHDGA